MGDHGFGIEVLGDGTLLGCRYPPVRPVFDELAEVFYSGPVGGGGRTGCTHDSPDKIEPYGWGS